MSNYSCNTIPPVGQLRTGPCMRFWEILNTVLEERGQPALLHGQMINYWRAYRDRVIEDAAFDDLEAHRAALAGKPSPTRPHGGVED